MKRSNNHDPATHNSCEFLSYASHDNPHNNNRFPRRTFAFRNSAFNCRCGRAAVETLKPSSRKRTVLSTCHSFGLCDCIATETVRLYSLTQTGMVVSDKSLIIRTKYLSPFTDLTTNKSAQAYLKDGTLSRSANVAAISRSPSHSTNLLPTG